ncbi:MAG: hypothetical protein A3E23_12465 [Burkholderiales bacterium RIFCSPHIGHO2_12_FULL_65_48]|nr:MAG: hypothetical protein A3C40_19770 [Burkholderiales bacterium RIFCSPHIGHO2_02_FULL_64_19]OGB21091.1 MAG: hypothetical protein A3E23_12465 [Burkholderiales bacterium RIFCSPHIGHO2_12_FULL_65_48]OGB52514.1 MAG: hypothetical protein A3F71_07860 [Burkholderiales bacterium RIFCSPLOWO2_12_FULL_64_33]
MEEMRMNGEIEHIGKNMGEQIVELISALQSTKEIKEDVFEKLDQSSRELARLLKGSEMLPRKLFKDLYSAARVLIAKAPYSKNPDLVQSMGAKLHMTADLIIWGQCHEDRQPGVPC